MSRGTHYLPFTTIEGLIAVISLCLTSFGLGYTIGSNKSQKQPPCLVN
ncbi:MAG: transmembrane 9 family protein [Lachnospiraceae bacterium]|nr:transmembrane 9 family protein [Lachnospiraceae bacterium]